MKTHRKTRIILIIIAALVAIFSSIAIITTTANKNNANAASVGAGSAIATYSHGSGAGGSKMEDVYWAGDQSPDRPGIINVLNYMYNTNAFSRMNDSYDINYMRIAVDNAIINCNSRNHGQCKNPRLVAMGWPQFAGNNGRGGWCTFKLRGRNYNSCPDGGTRYRGDFMEQEPDVTFCSKEIIVNNNKIKLNKTFGNAGETICGLINGQLNPGRTKAIAVVLSEDEYHHTGWKPVFTPFNSDAYANKVETTSTQLAPCTYAYSMQTVGVDGYVRNYETTKHEYKTAYGKFLDDVANGKYNGSYYYVGNGSNQITSKNNLQKTINDKLISDYKTACDAADKEVDNYNIESEEKPDKTGSTVISGKEFLQRYAKGGVYKVERKKLNGVLNYKTTSVKYYKSTSSYSKLTDWTPCTNENDGTWIPGTNTFVKCNYWNKNKPGNDVYPGKYNITHTGWSEINIKDTGNFFDHNIDKDKSILYYIGYIDENGTSQGSEKIKASDAKGWIAHKNAFIYGFTPNDDPASFSNNLHPVKQKYNSWIDLWHQDFMNILCDKIDFEAYKKALDAIGQSHGYNESNHLYTDISNESNGRYQGQLQSRVIESSWEPFDRVLYTVSTPVGSDNKLDMANAFTNIKSVVGDTSADTLLTKAKSVNSAYNTDNFIRWYNSSSYDASLDPVYTKECPYSCTDVGGGAASSAMYNILNRGRKKSDDRATGGDNGNDYGVRVRTTDSNGHLKEPTEDVNTANMTFFRNNTWNRFRVDIWYPTFDDGLGLTAASASDSIRGISETKGSQEAKSTTIIRNNGTPWYVKGTDSSSGFATEMKVIKSIDDGDSIDGSNARLFNPETNVITPGNQISLGSVTARGANVVELPYEATAFAIRSMWATDSNIGKLEFNIKWEFDSKNNLDVPTKFTVGNTADSVSSTSTPQYAISDGKCYGNQNKGQYYDSDKMIKIFHDSTGAGTIDNLDKNVSDEFGKFTIQFVRATAE